MLPAACAMLTPLSTAFDKLAAEYDDGFTRTVLGERLRRAVWRRLDALFVPGDRVLELACGTGEDAVHLGGRGIRVLATDASPDMVRVAREKVERTGLTGVDVRQLAVEDLDRLDAPPFDGALSNFGGLNCVADLRAAGQTLAARLRPGAIAVLCVMGPVVPWEWVWFLGRGKAFRRLTPGGVEWRGLQIRYPSIRTLRRALSPSFRMRRVAALGALLPPPYAETWAARHPRLIDRLDRWERRLETVPPLPWLADHYLMELERR
ncbi:MAG TPA: class I SAM-dependent methyltransferase [Thermoanaerobaculia bacterium]|nr:class I SAM-dependent methyltransferase [Thermoanaerobaculia bacterium]